MVALACLADSGLWGQMRGDSSSKGGLVKLVRGRSLVGVGTQCAGMDACLAVRADQQQQWQGGKAAPFLHSCGSDDDTNARCTGPLPLLTV